MATIPTDTMHRPDYDAGGAGTAGYWLAGLVFLAGLLAGGWLIYQAVVMMLQDDMERLVVPGRIEFQVAEPGRYRIYHEYRGTVDGRTYRNDRSPPSGLNTTVTDPDGRLMELRSPAGEMTYSVGDDRAGVKLWSFDAERVGVYSLEAAYDDTGQAPIVLAVGRHSVAGVVARMFGGFAAAGAGLLAGVVLLVVTLIRRGRSRTPPRPAAVEARGRV